MELKERIIFLCNQNGYSTKETKILNLLKLVMVDNEQNFSKILDISCLKKEIFNKYILEEQVFLKFITKEEYELFKEKVQLIKETYKQEYNIIEFQGIVEDIFTTRYTLFTVCKNNYSSVKKFKKMLNSDEFLSTTKCGKTKEQIKKRINETAVLRTTMPRNMYVVEDKLSISIVTSDIHYLNSSYYKKVLMAAHYLNSQADSEYLEKLFQTNFISIIYALCDPKLKEILKPECYELLNNYITKEKLLLENNLIEKKKFLNQMMKVVCECDFDEQLIIDYIKLPENLIKRILDQILNHPDFNIEIKSEIKQMINDKTKKLVK